MDEENDIAEQGMKRQAEAELCQAQFKLRLFFLMLIFFVFVFPVLKV